MGAHIVDGEFQSDKYPTCPAGKVPLSVRDPTAQDLLCEYAQRRRSVDAEFSDDLERALRDAGYAELPRSTRPIATLAARWLHAHPAALSFALDVFRATDEGLTEAIEDVRLLLWLLSADAADDLDTLVGALDILITSERGKPTAPAPGQMWLARDLSDEGDVYGRILVVWDHELEEDGYDGRRRVTFVRPNSYDLSGEYWSTMSRPENWAGRMDRGMTYRYLGLAPETYRRTLGLVAAPEEFRP
jgi:hypothetical protein